MTEEFKTEVKFSSYFAALLIIQDYLFAPFIIIGIENPNLQIIPIFLVLCLSVFLVAKLRPFKSKLKTLSIFINSLAYALILLIYLLCFNLSDKIDPITMKKWLGNLGCICILLLLLSNLVICLISTFLAIKGLYLRCRNNKTKISPS